MKSALIRITAYLLIFVVILLICPAGILQPALASDSSIQGPSYDGDANSMANPYILFKDDFNDGNADGWTTYGLGTWTVNNGEYKVDMGSGSFLLGYSSAGDVNWTDYIFEVDVKADLGENKAIYFRDNGVASYFVNIVGGYPYDHVLLGKNPDILFNDFYYPNTTGIWYHVKVVIISTNIKVYLNDQLLINYTASGSNLITQGRISLVGWTGAGLSDVVRFDNVVVRGFRPTFLPMIIRQ
jgi:hypothetical protein